MAFLGMDGQLYGKDAAGGVSRMVGDGNDAATALENAEAAQTAAADALLAAETAQSTAEAAATAAADAAALAAAAGGGGSAGFDLASLVGALPGVGASVSGSITTGVIVTMLDAATLVGVRVWWAPLGSAAIKASVWNAAGAVLATKTMNVGSGTTGDIIFDEPLSLAIGQRVTLGMWDTSGNNFTYVNTAVGAWPMQQPPIATGKIAFNLGYASGDAMPQPGSILGPITPLFA
jgi:hypothetical protein